MNPSRRRLLQTLALPALAAGAAGRPGRAQARAQAQAQGSVRMGLAPFFSPAALLGAFRSVREHLSRSLGQPVEMYTARDFRSLAEAAIRGEYDIALLPGHLAALLAIDHGWQPLVQTVGTTQVLVLVRDAGPLRAAAELRGQRVAMLDPLSLTATVGTLWLRGQGLQAPQDVQIVVMPSINSALLALQRDETAAVVLAQSQLATLPESLTGPTRALVRLSDIPAPLIMARPDADAATLQRWRDALLAFTPDPQRPPSAANVRMTPLTLADLAPLAAYADVARQKLAALR